jgi:hypothetical protein
MFATPAHIEKTNCFLCEQIHVALKTITNHPTMPLEQIKQKSTDLASVKSTILLTGMLFEYECLQRIDDGSLTMDDETLLRFLSVYTDLYAKISTICSFGI